MAKSVLSRTMLGILRSMSSRKKHIYIENLSNLIRVDEDLPLNVPPFCDKARCSEKGKLTCPMAEAQVQAILEEQDKPFAFVTCCWAGSKLAVIPLIADNEERKDAILVFCRSRASSVHERFMEEVAKISKVDAEELKLLWFDLPEFGPDLIEEVFATEQWQKAVLPEVRASAVELGEAYAQYAVDRLATDGAKYIVHCNWPISVLRVVFVSRPAGKIPVVRVYVANKEFQNNNGKDNPKGCRVPAAGFVPEEDCWDTFDHCLNSEKAVAVNSAFMETLPQQRSANINFDVEYTGKWKARVEAWLGDGKGQCVISDIKEELRRFVLTCLDSATKTTCPRMCSAIKNQDLNELKALLDLNVKKEYRWLHETPWMDQQTWYILVFEHLWDVFERKLVSKTNTLKHQRVIIRTMKSLEPCARMAVPSSVWKQRESLRGNLIGDLSSGSEVYAHAIERELIPFRLLRVNYDENVLENCLKLDIEYTIETLLAATKDRLVSLDDENGVGIRGWKKAIQYYKPKLGTQRNNLKKRIYEAGVPKTRQFLLEVKANSIAMLYKTLSFGLVFAAPERDEIYEKAYDKYVTDIGIFPSNSP